jgi:uncharacterized membrane protein (DUF4010 family)
MGAATLGGIGACLVFWRRSRLHPARDAAALSVSNPFELASALRFAVLFALVLLGSTAATTYLGTAGTYAAGVLAGTTDVDAITLSMAKLGGAAVPLEVAATTIFLGAASNTVVKGVLAAAVGGWGYGRRVLLAQLAVLACGAAGVAVAWGVR